MIDMKINHINIYLCLCIAWECRLAPRNITYRKENERLRSRHSFSPDKLAIKRSFRAISKCEALQIIYGKGRMNLKSTAYIELVGCFIFATHMQQKLLAMKLIKLF